MSDEFKKDEERLAKAYRDQCSAGTGCGDAEGAADAFTSRSEVAPRGLARARARQTAFLRQAVAAAVGRSSAAAASAFVRWTVPGACCGGE